MVGRAGKPKPGKAPAERASIRDVIGGVASAVSVVSAAAFVLSVIYEWGYFSVVGQKFQSIASLTDYLTNALDWLPAAVAVAAIYALGVVLFAMISGITAEENRATKNAAPRDGDKAPTAGQADGPDQQKEGDGSFWYLIGAIVFFAGIDALIYALADPAAGLWLAIMATFCVWAFVFALALDRGGEFAARIGTNTKLIALFVPTVSFGVFLWGLQHGYQDLNRPSELYHLIRKEAQPEKPQDVSVLRTFERGVLMRLPERQTTEFLRWEEIRSLSLQREGHVGKSLACRQLGWPC
jgi:hypothetical protein